MANFLSLLKRIGHDVVVADTVAAPFVSMINPAAGAIMTTISGLCLKAEAVYTGEKQGTPKKQMVQDEFTALFPIFQQALAARGIQLTWDLGSISPLIDSTVAQLNATKAFQDSFKVVDIPK